MRRFLLFLLVVGLAACGKSETASEPKFLATDITGVPWGRDFKLTDHNGNTHTLADFRGKVVALFFGYTHCPDVCPTTLAGLSQTMRLLGTDAQKIQVLFVTIDPERDTQDLLAKFVPAFDPSFIGLYGDAKATKEAADNFRADYRKHPGKSGYTMDHSTFMYVIDAQGKLRLLAGDREPADMLAQDIRLLLASTR